MIALTGADISTNSFVTQPNMYARGILFGKMQYELGDHSFVRCPELGLVADIEFKTKGYFSGKYNAIGGFVKDAKTDKHLFELSGEWNGEMFIKDLSVCHDRDVSNLRVSANNAAGRKEGVAFQRYWGSPYVSLFEANRGTRGDGITAIVG